MATDHGHAIHYAALEEGTAVYASDGEMVGTVLQVVDNYREHILDGIVIEDTADEIRFVDGPEVSRTFERGVLLSIDAAEVATLAPPEQNPAVFRANAAAGKIARFFGGGWKKR